MRKIFACGAKKYRLATLAGELGAIGSPKNDPLSVVHTRVSQPAVGEPSVKQRLLNDRASSASR